MIDGHGNDIYRLDLKVLADFSSNICPGKISNGLRKHLTAQLQSLNNYPEPNAMRLQKRIAKHHNLFDDEVFVTNGSTEAFYLLAQAFQNRRSTILVPSFSEYEDACKIHSHNLTYTSIIQGLKINMDNTDIVWLGNPNNPDGRVVPREEILRFCTENKDTFLIVDEAFAELCNGFESAVPLIPELKNLIILRSLTKTFSIPGLRLGYVVANKAIQKKIAVLRIPWSVNSMAIEAGIYIMEHYKSLLPDKKKLFKLSFDFQNKLSMVEGIEVTNSRCNYFLNRIQKGNVKDLKNYLLEEYGLLIRDASNFRSLDSSYFRLSAQNASYNSLLIECIQQWLRLI